MCICGAGVSVGGGQCVSMCVCLLLSASRGVWMPCHVCDGQRTTFLSVLIMYLGWDRVSCSSIHKQVSCTARFEEFSCLCFSAHCRDTKITGESILLHVAPCGFGGVQTLVARLHSKCFAHWTISPAVLAVFITTSKDLPENSDNV